MSNQPDPEQPSTSRGPLPGIPHGLSSRAPLPGIDTVAPPAVAMYPPGVEIVIPPAVAMYAPAVEVVAPSAVEIVASPAVSDEEVEMQQPQGVPATAPRAVAEPGFLSKVRDCMTCVPCISVQNASPVTEIADQAKEHARSTHYLSTFITRVQCFLLSTSKSKAIRRCNPDAEKFLGFRVQPTKKKNCDPLCHPCTACGVCPHMYSCTCSNLYKLKGMWCAHIHKMHTLTKGNFGKTMRLYIHTEIKYTQLRHFRALAQGKDFMRCSNESPLCYEAEIDDFDMSPKATVEELHGVRCSCSPAKRCPKCEVCRCLYKCSCIDYRVNGQVCQHIHEVAMIKQVRINSDDTVMPELESSYLYDVLVDSNMKYYTELEHEMSFYIDRKMIEQQTEPIPIDEFTGHYLKFVGDRLCYFEDFSFLVESAQEIVFESVSTEQNVASSSPESFEDKWWVVCRRSKSRKREVECKVRSWKARCICSRRPFYSSCTGCNICSAQYECTCPLDSAIICRHIHAVHQWRKNIEKALRRGEGLIRDVLGFPAERVEQPSAYENWLRMLPTT